MSKLMILFTVTAASFLIDKVYATQAFDIQNFLKSLQLQLKEEQQQALNKNSKKGRTLQKQRRDPNLQQRLKAINLKDYLQHRRPFRQSMKLVPNDFAGNLNLIEDQSYDRSSASDSRDEDAPSEYSKVFVVLNSEGIKKSRNKEKLNALLSSLLSVPSPKRNNRVRQRSRYDQNHHISGLYGQRGQSQNIWESLNNRNANRYKGFIVKRRLNRGSKEIYAKDALEKDVRPNRPRAERDVRGRARLAGNSNHGGGGSRTAIPYIRHHGNDIYERDS